MRSLLDALQEGRLVELPEVNKDKALEYLALLIEAIPDIGRTTDLVKAVQDREAQFNTGIGKSVAVPHCRTNSDGELLCAIGWSPHGIEYGSTDGLPVHLIVMYYVPDVQRNLYLKEISGLAKVLSESDSLADIARTDTLTGLRDHLLDWVSQAIGSAVPDSKARMIKLEARHASIQTSESETTASSLGSVGRFFPFQAVCFGDHVLILGSEDSLSDTFEHDEEFRNKIRNDVEFAASGYRIVRLSEASFSHGRTMISAVAFKNN